MEKLRRLKTLAVLTAMMVMLFSGCGRVPTRYPGPYLELATVVMNSVLGIQPMNGEVGLMDKDDFGRQMFAYWGTSYAVPSPWIIVVCISQKSDNKYVYYYPDDCFLIYTLDRLEYMAPADREKEMAALAWELMTDEEQETLKEKNDWGKPLDETRWVSTRINRTHMERTVKDASKRAFYDAIDYHPESIGSFYYLTTDAYGRCICYFGLKPVKYAVMFYPDGSFDYMVITDILHYQDEMKAAKLRNKWGNPIDSGK